MHAQHNGHEALFTLEWIFLAARKSSRKFLASVNTLDGFWQNKSQILFFSVCDLAVEKLDFQLVLIFSLREKCPQVCMEEIFQFEQVLCLFTPP